ncbi:hypothetical protein DP939_37330 [Spongiactinospora rosea]|uniref:Uncharacterized protein n=1 Tax=Spongiactinospora rosea TaxID=2248750 RepID=A0A366LMM5_9ACTN|nr:hypothetical protein [Spongiactinospora rosea]RBQ15067.1 hypothetical protein DP939_37330 [Spongiactinospora rosea]
MTDPYRIDHSPSHRPPPESPRPGSSKATLLWVLLAISVAGNALANIAAGGAVTPLGLAAGVVGLGAIAGLITHYVRGRRS